MPIDDLKNLPPSGAMLLSPEQLKMRDAEETRKKLAVEVEKRFVETANKIYQIWIDGDFTITEINKIQNMVSVRIGNRVENVSIRKITEIK